MVEIMLGVWLTSLLLSIPITALNVRYAYKLARSKKYILLNQNLAKVSQYWSLSVENFKNFDEGSREQDEQKALRTYLFLGVLGFFSALGLIFLIILTLSLRVLVKGRLTRQVFQSALTQDTQLPPDEVAKLVANLKSNSF